MISSQTLSDKSRHFDLSLMLPVLIWRWLSRLLFVFAPWLCVLSVSPVFHSLISLPCMSSICFPSVGCLSALSPEFLVLECFVLRFLFFCFSPLYGGFASSCFLSFSCPSVCRDDTTTPQLRQLRGVQPSWIVLFTEVLFLQWEIKMLSLKKAYCEHAACRVKCIMGIMCTIQKHYEC